MYGTLYIVLRHSTRDLGAAGVRAAARSQSFVGETVAPSSASTVCSDDEVVTLRPRTRRRVVDERRLRRLSWGEHIDQELRQAEDDERLPPPPPPASDALAMTPWLAVEEPTTSIPLPVHSPSSFLRAPAVLVPACCVAGDAVAARCASSHRTAGAFAMWLCRSPETVFAALMLQVVAAQMSVAAAIRHRKFESGLLPHFQRAPLAL